MSNDDDMDITIVPASAWQMLPPAPDLCQKCATKHDPELPHNQQSLYWKMWFQREYGRAPTWEDAMEHCSPEMKEHWKFELSRVLDEPMI